MLNVLEYFTHVLCSSNQLATARGLISIKHSFRPLTYTEYVWPYAKFRPVEKEVYVASKYSKPQPIVAEVPT